MKLRKQSKVLSWFRKTQITSDDLAKMAPLVACGFRLVRSYIPPNDAANSAKEKP